MLFYLMSDLYIHELFDVRITPTNCISAESVYRCTVHKLVIPYISRLVTMRESVMSYLLSGHYRLFMAIPSVGRRPVR